REQGRNRLGRETLAPCLVHESPSPLETIDAIEVDDVGSGVPDDGARYPFNYGLLRIRTTLAMRSMWSKRELADSTSWTPE
ncbi:MAG: hypothetical protein WBM46_15145, partial [Polyangiales bacterium]